MKTNWWVSIFLFFLVQMGLSQSVQIVISAHNKPLKEICFELSYSHNVQFSFNEKVVENCTITHEGSYSTLSEALTEVLATCDLNFTSVGEVIIIKKNADAIPKKNNPEKYFLQAEVIDKTNGETLPYATVSLNDQHFICDANGYFSATTKTPKNQLHISFVGYATLDTTIPYSSQIQTLELSSMATELEELVILAEDTLKTSTTSIPSIPKISPKAGLVKLNANLASLLPGGSDNTLFNLSRLMPGIMAAGEQSKDFTIWGSYKGQTEVTFDGITLFNLGSHNPQIGIINPLIIKDIEIHKGGYNADIGNRIGGVIKMTGLDGHTSKWGTQIRATNETFSALANIPIFKTASLQLGVRKSHNSLNLGRIEDFRNVDFTDANVKYTHFIGKNDIIKLSALAASENFSVEKNNEMRYRRTQKEESTQYGGSLGWTHRWQNSSTTNALISHTGYHFSLDKSIGIQNTQSATPTQNQINTQNSIDRYDAKLWHQTPKIGASKITVGIKFIHNQTQFTQDSTNQLLKSVGQTENRIEGFVKNEISLGDKITITPGAKLTYQDITAQLFFQPRLRASYHINNWFSVHSGAGLYQQFLSENAVSEAFGNQYYFWSINNSTSQVSRNSQVILGTSLKPKTWEFKVEGFYKKYQNLNRYYFDPVSKQILYSTLGSATSMGMDVYLSKSFGKQHIWASYTVSNTEENFSFFQTSSFRRAPQDQTHELKTAAILDFKPFYFSTNYIYGSGLKVFADPNQNFEKTKPYSRWDAAFSYKIEIKPATIEAGVSVLNILNTNNIRYDDFYSFPDKNVRFRSATPFRPMIFVNIGL